MCYDIVFLKKAIVMVSNEFVVMSFSISGSCAQLVDAEVALYLRTLCKHLQTEAQVFSDNLLVRS